MLSIISNENSKLINTELNRNVSKILHARKIENRGRKSYVFICFIGNNDQYSEIQNVKMSLSLFLSLLFNINES